MQSVAPVRDCNNNAMVVDLLRWDSWKHHGHRVVVGGQAMSGPAGNSLELGLQVDVVHIEHPSCKSTCIGRSIMC